MSKVFTTDGAEGARVELVNPSKPPVSAIARDLTASDLPPGVVLTEILPGQILGLQIDAPLAALPVALTGLEVGENLRFRSRQSFTLVGAAQVLALEPQANWIVKTSGASVSLSAMTGGAPGRIIALQHTSGGNSTTTLEHDTGGTDGFLCPGGVPFVYGGGTALGGGTTLIHGFAIYDTVFNRWLVHPRGVGRTEQADFTGSSYSWTTAGNFVADATGELRLRSLDGACLVAGHPNYAAVAAGDVVIAANSGILVAATGTPPTAAAGTGAVDVQADSLFRVTTNGVERLEIEDDGAWQVGTGLTGSAGQALISAGAGAPPAWGLVAQAGLSGGILASLLGTTPAATNATTNLSCGAITIPANTTQVGFTFRANQSVEFIHTAAAAPTLTLEWVYGGSVVLTRVVTVTAVAGTYTLWSEAYFRFDTIGAAGSARASIRCVCTAGATVADQIGDTQAAVAALNTTISRTLELRVRMTTAVAANTITLHQATLDRLINL